MSGATAIVAFGTTAVACAFTVLAACSGERSNYPEYAIRDSAGVRIVTSRPATVRRWWISSQPLVQVGNSGKEAEQQLYRVTGALRLPDGAIAIANTGSGEILVYDSLGALLRSEGRLGDGPGEYRNLRLFRQQGTGRVVAYDLSQSRLSFLDDGLSFARSVTLQAPPAECPVPLTILENGATLTKPVCTSSPRDSAGAYRLSGVYRNRAAFRLYAETGDFVRTVVRLPGPEAAVSKLPGVRAGCGGPSQPPCLRFGAALFGRGAPTTSDGTRLYYSDAASFDVRVFTLDGTLSLIIRRLMARRMVTEQDISAYLARRSGSSDAGGRSMPEWRSHPAEFPSLEMLRTDAAGLLWVQHYVGPRDTEQIWSVFDTSGRFLAEVPMPADLTVYDIGVDWVLVGWRDEMDVQYVRLYGLRRTDEGASVRTDFKD